MTDADSGAGARVSVVADLVAGVSMAGLLLPEAVAYSGIAGMPPQAGVLALFAGLLVYGLIGRSRFAIVSATSSSAAVLGAATLSLAGHDAVLRAALAAGLVLATGLAFLAAGSMRLGSICSFISKPVLRGFSFGLALVIILKQLSKLTGTPTRPRPWPQTRSPASRWPACCCPRPSPTRASPACRRRPACWRCSRGWWCTG